MGRLGGAVCLEVVLLRSREVAFIGTDKVSRVDTDEGFLCSWAVVILERVEFCHAASLKSEVDCLHGAACLEVP